MQNAGMDQIAEMKTRKLILDFDKRYILGIRLYTF